jgi:hypothetical protein
MANSAGQGAKRNLTVQLDEEIIQAAKELAARRGTSVSGLVTQKLRELVEEHIRYEEAKQRALEAMRNAEPGGGRDWKREDLSARVDRWT